MEAQLKTLVAERKPIKWKLTTFKRHVNAFDGTTDIATFERLVKANEDLLKHFDQIQSKIYALDLDTEAEELQLKERETFEIGYCSTMAIADRHIASFRGPQLTASRNSSESPALSDTQAASRIPLMSLPTFDGDVGRWIRFRDTFLSLVHNSDRLTDIDRFNYLESALRGSAARLIESLGVSEGNYRLAWSRLKERYEDPKALVDHHLNALLEIPPVKGQDGEALGAFIDTATNHINALESLMSSADAWSALISLLLSKRVDSVTLDEWDKRTMDMSGRPTFREFSKFIEKRAQYLLRKRSGRPNPGSALTTGHPRDRDNRHSGAKHRSYVAAAHVANTRTSCLLCKGEHTLQYCQRFASMSFPERHETVKRFQGCFNCLQPGHSIQNCTRGMCRRCGRKHHTLLHKGQIDIGANSATSAEDTPRSHVIQSCVSNSAGPSIEYTVLSTAVVYIQDRAGNKHKCRALLDVGSQAHFVTEDFCRRLNLPRIAVETMVGGLGRASNPIRSKVQLALASQCNKFNSKISCLVLPNITEEMPNVPLRRDHIRIPAGVIPADPNFHQQGRIDLLIGASLFWKLLCIGQHKVESSDLIWQKTRLGWVLGGSLSLAIESRRVPVACHTVTNLQLHKALSQFWEVEEASPIRSAVPDICRSDCEQKFEQTTVRDDDGRYIVAIPFNDKLRELGESRSQAEKRLLNLERKFRKDPELKEKYGDFMREYEALGHMSIVRTETMTGPETSYYLPHHAVFKTTSTTTKIRVVFDGSAKTSSGISLNDAQLVGPPVQSDLISILIKFRKHRFVLSADIEKMYRQVRVREEDRRYQRILWRDNEDETVRVYNLNTVTYGTASASFLATRVLKRVAEDHALSSPHLSKVIMNDFYVDDLLTGCEDIKQAIQTRESLTSILAQAGFPIRKWASNDPRIVAHDQGDASSRVEIQAADKDPKTLGLLWAVKADELRYSINECKSSRVTKRHILSEIAKIFDPLGLIGPVITKAKLIMQRLWQLHIGWDESLPQDIHTEWVNFQGELMDLSSLVIPRRAVANDTQGIELHGFSDASEKAYGAAVYLRTRTGNGAWLSRLLCAKSRVAPLKTISMPRLELCGAVLLSQLACRVKDVLNDHPMREYYWTDSTIVLSWIRSEPCRWKTFVANRVSEIQRATSPDHWRHVISGDNPADLISRGSSPLTISMSSLWWCGPPWLSRECHEWPSSEPAAVGVPEARQTNVVHLATSDATAKNTFDLPSRYSSYQKLLRVTAYCIRFIANIRDKIRTSNSTGDNSSPPTAAELTTAERKLLSIAQQTHFANELESLTIGKPIQRQSSLASFDPFLDEHGLIRVGGRLMNAPITFEQKHPVILPASHPLTSLIVRNEHSRLLHAGCQRTLASLRCRFWIISGRRVVRKIVRQCINCFRANPIGAAYQMGNLPAERVTPTRAFATCGVDYAGPFLIRERGRGRVAHKTYVCLFVCFSTKAVHIELATDLSTDAFLNCLHRFISRRGRCHSIHSDNGRNFIGARNQLNELGILLNDREHNNRVQHTLAQEKIEWHLIPPYAPNFGGLWEGGIKSAKTHLRRVIGEQRLTYEELYTILTQIQACLNSRPLHPLSSDPMDPTPLTPGHFLIGDAIMALPQPDITDIRQNRLNRYQLIQQAVQHFWKRWHQDYLHELQQRHKWNLDSPGTIKIGTMVLVKDDNLPPLQWRLGMIAEVHPGPDGVTRVVTLKTSDGDIKRSVTKVCILPDAEDPL